MYWSDFFYILTLVLFVVSLIMSGMVRRRFKRYAEERTANGMTGAMAADRILRANGITDVTIPEGVTTIGAYAFFRCSALERVTIPEDVSAIEKYVFTQCALKTIMLPSSIRSIGEGAFVGNNELTSLTIPFCFSNFNLF